MAVYEHKNACQYILRNRRFGFIENYTPRVGLACCCSVTKSCPTLFDPMDYSTSGSSVFSLSPGGCSDSCLLNWWRYLSISSSATPFSSCPQSFPASGSFHHIWRPENWSFSFSISPRNEYSRFICFRIDWFDLLEVQETLKSLLQHHNLKAPVLQCSAFFMIQASHPYMTTGKIIILTILTSVSKMMSLLFNMLSRFVIAFLPRSKHILISWLWSPWNAN